MEAFSALNYFITFSSGHTERKSKWSGQFPDVTMGSPLSPGLDAITIFLHGVCDCPPSLIPKPLPSSRGRSRRDSTICQGGGGGVSSPFICSPHLSCQISRCADGGPLWPADRGGGRLAQPHFLSLLTFCLAGRSCGRS